MPVVMLARVAATVEVGTELTLLADDEAAVTGVPAWCRLRRHEFLGAEPLSEEPATVAYKIRVLVPQPPLP